jgi:hypothetical protein
MSRTDKKKSKSTIGQRATAINRQGEPSPSPKRRRINSLPENPIATLSASELAWTDITPTGRIDDAEGFLGLEEIADVEVIRDGDGSRTRFRVYPSLNLLTCSL